MYKSEKNFARRRSYGYDESSRATCVSCGMAFVLHKIFFDKISNNHVYYVARNFTGKLCCHLVKTCNAKCWLLVEGISNILSENLTDLHILHTALNHYFVTRFDEGEKKLENNIASDRFFESSVVTSAYC